MNLNNKHQKFLQLQKATRSTEDKVRSQDNRVYVVGTDQEFDPVKDYQLGSVASNYLRNVLYRYNNINSNRRNN